jgi:uncharacterized damage-inducible protein DinB
MPESKEGLLQQFQQTRAEILAAIQGLSDAHMTETSIDGWSVKDHLAHIAVWDDLRAGEVTRISAGYASVWRMTDAQDDAYNEMCYALRKELSLDQVRWEFATTRQRLLDAITAATARGLDASLYGEAGLASRHEVEHAGWIRRWRTDKGI